MIRLPFEPLEAELERREGRRLTESEIALLLGIKRQQVYVYRVSGLSPWKADTFAVECLGSHPLHIWGLTAWIGSLEQPDD